MTENEIILTVFGYDSAEQQRRAEARRRRKASRRRGRVEYESPYDAARAAEHSRQVALMRGWRWPAAPAPEQGR